MIYDLVVIGAGPTGLLCALGAARRGCKRILVLEQARSFREVGNYLDVTPNGAKALRLVAPAVHGRLLEKYGRSRKPFVWFDAEGVSQVSVSPDDVPDQGLLVPWHKLQGALLEALPENVEVRTHAQVTSLNDIDGPEFVRICYVSRSERKNVFSNWDSSTIADEEHGDACGGECEVLGRLVIAADGINSRVREVLYRHVAGDSAAPLAKPSYTGMTQVNLNWTGVPPDAEDALAELYKRMDENDCFFSIVESSRGVDRRLVRYIVAFEPPPSEIRTLCLICNVNLEMAQAENTVPFLNEVSSIVQEELSWQPFVQLVESLVNWGEPHVEVKKWSLWTVPLDESDELESSGKFRRPFGAGRVWLAGDALHGFPPVRGQGTAQGFEDACELIDLLAHALKWEDDDVQVPLEVVLPIEARYRAARLQRLSFASSLSVRPTPLTDGEGYKSSYARLVNFAPKATGWNDT